MARYSLFFLIAIFLLGFALRLYRFDNPVADWHSFRQSDTNAVSQRYVNEGINLLYPKYFDLSNIQSGVDNPEGLRMVEFPVYNAAQAILFNTIGIFTLEQWGRLLTIILSLTTGLFVYLLARKYAGERAGVVALIVYLFLPFSIYYGRVILPDPSMTALIMGGVYFFDMWLASIGSKKSQFAFSTQKYLFISILLTALAFLLKPFAIFFTIPMVYLAWKKFGASIFKKWQLYIFGVLTLVPLVAWRMWISQFPEGIPASDWLFNGSGIRARPSFFYWIFYKRITELILGYTGIIAVLIGVIGVVRSKNAGFFLSFGLSMLVYLFVIATGNVQHDYYQILITPTIAMFSGVGVSYLIGVIEKRVGKTFAFSIVGVLIVLSFYFSWHQVRDYFNINDGGMVAAGKKANEILPKDAVVIAPYDNSTTLLNIIARPGWPTFYLPIEELIARGATHLVIANPTESDFEGFGQEYKRLAESSDYLILELK